MGKAKKIAPAEQPQPPAPLSSAAVVPDRRPAIWRAYAAADDCLFSMRLVVSYLPSLRTLGPRSQATAYKDRNGTIRASKKEAERVWDVFWNLHTSSLAVPLAELEQRCSALKSLITAVRPAAFGLYGVHDDAIRAGNIAAPTAIDATLVLTEDLIRKLLGPVPRVGGAPAERVQTQQAVEAQLRESGYPALHATLKRIPDLEQDIDALGIRLQREQAAVEVAVLGEVQDSDLSAAQRLIWHALECAAKSTEDLVAILGIEPGSAKNPSQIVFNHIAAIRATRGENRIINSGGWYMRSDAPPPAPPTPRRRRRKRLS